MAKTTVPTELSEKQRWVLYFLLFVQVLLWYSFFGGHRGGGRPLHGWWLVPLVLALLLGQLAGVFLLFHLAGGFERATRSLLRAVLLLILLISFVTWVFASLYYFLIGMAGNFNVPLSHVDAVFVALGTLSTAGTGGITAHSEVARGLLTVQMFVDFSLLAAAVAWVVASASGSREARRPKGSRPRSLQGHPGEDLGAEWDALWRRLPS